MGLTTDDMLICFLNDSKLLIEKIRRELKKPHRDQKSSCAIFEDVNDVLRNLSKIGSFFDVNMRDFGDRLNGLEKQMEELKKRFPVGDGK